VRIAFVTDNHFDAHKGLDETVRVHQWIAEDAKARGCSLTLLGGDLFEKKSCAEDRNAAADWLISMAALGEVVGVAGNHEEEGGLEILNLLRGRHPIRFYSRAELHRVGDVVIGCLPWPHRGQLLAGAESTSHEDASVAARAALRSVIAGLGVAMDDHPDCARIGLGHVMRDGATTDHDQPIVGAEMAISDAELAPMRAGIYLLGHVHAQQEGLIGAAPWLYGGAPTHCNFGEPGAKGYTIIETDGPRIAGFERVATPATPMILAEGAFDGVTLSNSYALRSVYGADVRLRYRVAADRRESAKAAAADVMRDLLERGAKSVKLEELVETETRARAPEVARAVSHRDKLEAHWASVGFDSGPRREALLAKADYLHEVTREA
jgi:DNA repair exonuclease SbcCD nuclease subunit